MGKEGKREEIKQEILSQVIQFLRDHYDTDVMKIDKGKIMMPCVDAEGEEFYFTFTATIPRGRRNGESYEPFNGYELAKTFEENEKIELQNLEIEKQKKAAEVAKKAEGKKVKKAIQNLEKAVQKVNGG